MNWPLQGLPRRFARWDDGILEIYERNPGWSTERSRFAAKMPTRNEETTTNTKRRLGYNTINSSISTCIVFLKFFGSSGSSNGYAPTNITYRVTPQDHTSAIYYIQRIIQYKINHSTSFRRKIEKCTSVNALDCGSTKSQKEEKIESVDSHQLNMSWHNVYYFLFGKPTYHLTNFIISFSQL